MTFRIRQATDTDIAVIPVWFVDCPDAESLSCNWKNTLAVYHKIGMLVVEHIPTSEPIAYFWGDLAGVESVLEVRHDWRRQGVGQFLVNHLIEQARAGGRLDLTVACSPITSRHFWRRMGFEVEREGQQFIGRRSL